MAAPTPARTNAEIWANKGLTGGRISTAIEEVRRRLETQLPSYIDWVNDTLNLSGEYACVKPVNYMLAPAAINDNHVNSVLVGASVGKDAQGTQQLRNNAVVTIFLVAERIVTNLQVRRTWDQAELIEHVLQQYLTGCVDLQGRFVWRQLVQLESELLPDAWKEYSGVSLPYRLIQSASDDQWEV